MNGVVIGRIDGNVEDHLPIVVRWRSVLVVVEPANDDRSVNVAPDELHEYHLPHRRDAHQPDPLSRDRNASQNQAGIPQAHRAGMIVLVRLVRVRMLFLDDRQFRCAHPRNLVPHDPADRVEQGEGVHSSPPIPSSPPPPAPVERISISVTNPRYLSKRWRTRRTMWLPSPVPPGAPVIATTDPGLTRGAPPTRTLPVAVRAAAALTRPCAAWPAWAALRIARSANR